MVAVAGVLVASGLVVRHRLAPKHFEVVEPGVLYRSATLPPGQLLDVVHRYHVRTVVNLRSREENREAWHGTQRDVLERVGVAMVDLPMERGSVPVAEVEARWLELLADPAARPILVHCEYGVVRTGIMVSVYELAWRGASPDGLFGRMPMFGHELPADLGARIAGYLTGFATRRPPHVTIGS